MPRAMSYSTRISRDIACPVVADEGHRHIAVVRDRVVRSDLDGLAAQVRLVGRVTREDELLARVLGHALGGRVVGGPKRRPGRCRASPEHAQVAHVRVVLVDHQTRSLVAREWARVPAAREIAAAALKLPALLALGDLRLAWRPSTAHLAAWELETA